VNSDLGGVAVVAGVAILITFIGVLWPIGFLSQALLYFALFSRSRKAPKGSALAAITTFAGRGPTVDVLVQTPYTSRWNNLGDLG
jgi:hypothetical protein